MAKDRSLSLREQWLAERLKRARKSAGHTLENAAEHLQLDSSTLSRFETGTYRIRRAYIKELVDFYGISSEREREMLIQLSQDSWRKDWWDGDTKDLEIGFIDHTWLEARAQCINVYTPMLIPGLLQTTDYAKAVMVNGPRSDSKHVARMVELRLARQRILDGDSATKLSVIIEETPLRRPVGGSHVLAGQLRKLLKANGRQAIQIHVLPTSVGWHPGELGPFTYFEMHDPYPDVACVESLGGRTFVEEQDKVARFWHAYDGMKQVALSAGQSTKFISNLLKDLE